MASFFGSQADIEAHYASVFASAEYAQTFRPDADDIRQRRIDAARKRRIRKPTLSTVRRMAEAAGLSVAAFHITRDGVTIVPGTPSNCAPAHILPNAGSKASSTTLLQNDADVVEANPWDQVLQ